MVCACGVINGSFPRQIESIATLTDMSPMQKSSFYHRYVKIVQHMEVQMKRTTFMYNIFSLLTTIGSILVPALIAIQDKPFSDSDDSQEAIEAHNSKVYWAGWGVSLVVTISNGIIKLFSLDKTYITRHLRYNDFKKEGWLFLQLGGHYNKFTSHKRAFSVFASNIETIKTLQIHEEFVPENSASFNDARDHINRGDADGNVGNVGNGGESGGIGRDAGDGGESGGIGRDAGDGGESGGIGRDAGDGGESGGIGRDAGDGGESGGIGGIGGIDMNTSTV